MDKAQNAAQVLARYHAKRAQAVAILGGVCAVCGTADDLELDHIDPAAKSFTLNNQKLGRYMAELGKCQLLCARHHREKTARQFARDGVRSHRSVDPETGRRRYCGCADCKARRNEAQRRYRAAKAV